MELNKKGGSQGEPNIDLAETAGSALAEDQSTSTKSSSSSIQLVVERESSFEEEEEESADKVESWGVYIANPEKTLVGLFWDKEIAQFFKDAVQDSPLIKTLGKVAQQ